MKLCVVTEERVCVSVTVISAHAFHICDWGFILAERFLVIHDKNLKKSMFKVDVKSVCKQTVCLHFELLYFLKYEQYSTV